MCEMQIANDNLLFKEENHFFVFNGHNGELLDVPQSYYDLIRYLKIFNINDQNDIQKLQSFFSAKYSVEQLEKAVADIRNYFSSMEKCNEVYKAYDKKIENTNHHNGLWLNISHDCNLRCQYCFGNGGDYGNQRVLMTKEVAKKCIDIWYKQIDEKCTLFEVNFFGGEPLLNQETLIYCVNYINGLFKNRKNKVRYNITTNGTIVDERLLKLFQENHFRVSISIDGIEKIHDLNRKYVSGKGSFEDIAANVKKFRKYLPKISAQITLTKEGIPYLTDAVMELWNMGINMVRSNLVFDNTIRYTYDDYKIYHNEIKRISELTYQNLINNRPYTYQNLVNKLKIIHNRKLNVNCFFWGGGAMIFSPEGERYRCYRFMEDEQHKLSDNIVELREKKPYIDKCSECWAQLLCADGCVYENSVYSNDINEPAEEWCVKTKISLEEALRLYARLIVNSPQTLDRIVGRKDYDRK